jgi:hypothetical protein
MDKKYTKRDFGELINFEWTAFKVHCRVDDLGVWLLERNDPVFNGLSKDLRDLFLVHPDRNANVPVLPFPFSIDEFIKFAALPAFEMQDFYTFLDNTIDLDAIERLERIHAPAGVLARALIFGERPKPATLEAHDGEPGSFSSQVEPATVGPLPLITGDIAFCFAGLGWSEEQWKKPLADKPKWLAACVAIPAVRGVSATRWNPVLIGAALERHKQVKQIRIRARFQTQLLLRPWLDAWKTYETENFDSK